MEELKGLARGARLKGVVQEDGETAEWAAGL